MTTINIGSIEISNGGINYRGALIQAARYRLFVGLGGRLTQVQAIDADGIVVAMIDVPRTTITRTREIQAEFAAMFGG
jgi:hypothetical protein